MQLDCCSLLNKPSVLSRAEEVCTQTHRWWKASRHQNWRQDAAFVFWAATSLAAVHQLTTHHSAPFRPFRQTVELKGVFGLNHVTVRERKPVLELSACRNYHVTSMNPHYKHFKCIINDKTLESWHPGSDLISPYLLGSHRDDGDEGSFTPNLKSWSLQVGAWRSLVSNRHQNASAP